MKKLVLLLSVFALVLTSCNKDDDNNSSQDLFIGTWKFHKYLENDVEQPLDTCETEDTILVSANGTFSTTDFEENIDGNCEQVDITSGTWANLGNGNYATTVEGETATEHVTFEGNTFYIIDSYMDGNETIVEKIVYIRS